MTRLDRTLWPAVALLAAALVVCQCTGADVAFQDLLYNFEAGRWLLPRDSRPLEFIFHQLPKYLIFLLAAILLLRFFAGDRLQWRWLLAVPKPTGRRLAVLILTLGLTPALVSLGKVAARSHCPWAVQRYGGPEPYVKPLSRNEECCPPSRRGECWPAGHASGGFALVALASLALTRRGMRRGILTGLITGVITGGYQMMKGAHYISDTVVTMLVAWIIHLLLRRVLLRERVTEAPSPE